MRLEEMRRGEEKEMRRRKEIWRIKRRISTLSSIAVD
jgi:hypothetical protein